MAAGDAQGFRVDPAALESHAAAVDAIAGRIEQARDAGASVLVGASAYGVICSILPVLLQPAQRQTVDTLAQIGTGLRNGANGVRQAAQSYAGLDGATADAYRRVGNK
jgi:uncharacterized protein YukE